MSNNNFNIIEDPDYDSIYKELTLLDYVKDSNYYKINIFCEDDIGEKYLKMIIKFSRNNLSKFNFIHNMFENQKGTSKNNYISLIKNGEFLLKNSIIVFDPDVLNDVKKISKKKSLFCVLPSIYNMPIEKELYVYLLSLDNNNSFFINTDHEKAYYLNLASKFNIDINIDLVKIKDTNVDYFKNYFKNFDKKSFNLLMKDYILENKSDFYKFRIEFIDKLNQILKKYSLPIIAK